MKESDPLEGNPADDGGETKEKSNGRIPEALHTVTALSGMYQDWFLDYASYVILERAVPHMSDGLKPVQRRILYSMKRMDDGRFNKVANIIGHTMQFHPHGDASIGDALVQLGQKELLVEAQGNWGNILTGDSAAAARYIEARLSKFALEVAFNNKTTEWMSSYDGRNKEPVTLPVKFPLLLAMGVEGIAVGLASKILPHNFNELIDASINHLQHKPFVLYPDFPTGGMIDISRYNDGARGGAVKVRARIEKVDKKGLVITEVPFGRTTSSLIESIVKASDRGKIKIKRIDDNTAGGVEIVIQLQSGISPDKTIDALYAFTDCELSISPNACVITDENKPAFVGVSDILRHSVDLTVKLLTRELEIRKAELEEEWHFSSLEKIFIEKRIYRDIEESETWEAVITAIDIGLKPYKKLFKRDITRDDIIRLTEIKIKRISKYDSSRADEHIKNIEGELEEVINHLGNIIPYTINYYRQIKKKYGKNIERRTEIRSFETIEASKVVAVNAKLYVNRQEGFIGTGLKKDEYICDCSDLDDIIVIRKDGTYLITRVTEKLFVGKDVIHVQVFLRNDARTIYNIVYLDGREGSCYVKRCALTGLTRDKEYSLGRGTTGTRILYLSANPNGEAEVIRVYHKPRARLKKLTFDFDFGELAIKGRASMGNILTKNAIHKITLKEKGLSTQGGRKLWFDEAVMRLNVDGRGRFLGEFASEDMLLVITRGGWFRTSGTDLSLHFEDDLLLLEKYRETKIFSVVYWDQEQGFYYVKRFVFEESERLQCLISDSEGSKLISLTEVEYPRLEISFGGKNEGRRQEIIEVAEFIGVKSFRAKGKRLSNFSVTDIRELEPVVKSEAAPPPPFEEEEEEPGPAPQGPLPDDPAQMKLDL
ncbi:MAG: DNA gyrase/topoisomerase IV subunit A [Bacteroidales bacterium]|nr:DNA gyrase/topoisomerase IV subunit A [Bacteroidales bacterium]